MGVGISMDQSATNQMLGNKEGTSLWPPESMDGITVCVTPNSTGDYVVQECIKHQGFNIENVNFIYGQQAECIAALTPTENETSKVCLLQCEDTLAHRGWYITIFTMQSQILLKGFSR